MSTEYNGHKTKGHWNISLWVSNDENLYSLARDCKKTASDIKSATRRFLNFMGDERTPDGFKYTYTRVYEVMKEI